MRSKTRAIDEWSVGYPSDRSSLALARARACADLGDRARAEQAAAEARDYVLRVAESIDDADARRTFLGGVKSHAAVLALAEQSRH